jgi:hypothetical protein
MRGDLLSTFQLNPVAALVIAQGEGQALSLHYSVKDEIVYPPSAKMYSVNLPIFKLFLLNHRFE